MTKDNNVIFCEVQKFSKLLRGWLILDSLVVIGIVLFLFLYLGNKQTQQVPTAVIVLILIVLTVVPILFLMTNLQTEVRFDGLYIRFFPFHVKFKRFAFEDFSQYYARKYSPLFEYGGWGIRFGMFGAGKAYNVSGNKGVQLVFKNGKKLLIGSQKADELAKAIESVTKK